MRALAVGCLAVLAVQLAAGAAAMNTVCTDKPCPKCAPSDPCVAAGLITCLPFSPTKKGLCYDAQRRKTVSTYRLADIDSEQPT